MPPVACTLELIPPNRLRLDGREATVGPTVYVAIAALTAAGGRLAVSAFCRAVWGGDAAKRAVWSLCHRANEKLQEIGHPGRVGTDGPDVCLY